MARLLIVEDDDVIGGLLESNLRRHDHDVTWARTARSALRAAQTTEIDLALVDLGLPDLDGVELCRRLRATQPGTVLVVLTARHSEMDIVLGLEAGADDYLTKPFRFAELLARIRAHLRRGTGTAALAPTLTVGDLRVDVAGRRCMLAGVEIELRAREFDLLARLAAEPDVAISREQLMSDVWDEHWYGSTKTLDVHIAALRRKLGTTGPAIPQIVTLRGRGYRLEIPAGH